MPNKTPDNPAASRVYLSLVATTTGPRLDQDPLTAPLELGLQTDDTRLLIALGEVCGSNRPIRPIRITQLPGALILWLDQQEWLVLPHARYGYNLGQALEQSFGAELWLEPIPDGSFQAELTETAVLQLRRASSNPLNGCDLSPLEPMTSHSICIRPWALSSRYDLLLSLADQACLETWLQQLQAPSSLASQA